MQQFSVGIIGAGDIVKKVHLPVLSAMENVRVEWITDVNPARAITLARSYNLNYCQCPDDLTNLPNADVVLLAIPFGAREPYYEALRERDCAIYVEKPFSRSMEHHQRICSWFPDNKLACGFHRRSWGPTLMIKKLVEMKLFGELLAIDFAFGGPGIVTGGGYSSNLELAGGGILFETAVHGIDALLFVSSAVDLRFNEINMISDEGFDLHTFSQFNIETARQRTINCQIVVSCLEETSNHLEFVFEHAVLAYSLFGDGGISLGAINGPKEFGLSPIQKAYPLTTYQTFYEHWRRFLSGLVSGEASWTSASQSLLTTAVLEQLYAPKRQATPVG
jgi:predicted dehydrogenase